MYGGTQAEMQRLLEDAEKISGIKYDISSYADIVDAIHVVQTEMGMTGTTAKEAGTTIQGSVASMKSAWTNLLTGLADGNANIEQLIDNLVTTIVGDGTESNLGVLGNIIPAVETALSGASTLVSKAFPKIMEIIPAIINDNLPVLVEAAVGIVQSLVDGISQNQEMLFDTILDVVTYLAESFITMLPQIVQLGLDLIVSLSDGISESLPELLPVIVDVVLQIVDTLIANAPKLLDAAFEIITKLASGLVDNFPEIVAKGREIIEKIISGISELFGDLVQKGKDIIDEVKSGINEKIDDAKQWGKDLIQNFIDGITAKWNALKEKVSGVAQTVKNFLGFSEPKEGPLSNFHTYAPDMMELFAKGIKDNETVVTDQIAKSFDFGEQTIKFGTEYRDGFGMASANGATFGGTSIGNVTINIDGAKYNNENSLAEAIADALQSMTDRRAAVYA